MPNAVHLIGVPLDMGGSRRGVDMGPSAFRIAGLSEKIAALGRVVADRGDLLSPIPETKKHGDPTKKYIKEIAKVCDRVYQTARTSLEEGALPLVLGGDHSLGAGSVAASAAHARAADKPLGLLWIDAHGDMNTPASTPSGNVHGMPLAALLGPEPSELSSIGGFSPTVAPGHTALIGVRNLDDREKDLVRNSGVHVYTIGQLDAGREGGFEGEEQHGARDLLGCADAFHGGQSSPSWANARPCLCRGAGGSHGGSADEAGAHGVHAGIPRGSNSAAKLRAKDRRAAFEPA